MADFKKIFHGLFAAALCASFALSCASPSSPSPGPQPVKVDRVIIQSEAKTTLYKGRSRTFTATVVGSEGVSQAVEWSLALGGGGGDYSLTTPDGTSITKTGGELSISKTETAKELSIRAVSTVDTGKFDRITVVVLGEGELLPVTEIAISGLDAPVALSPLDTGIDEIDSVVVNSVSWYEGAEGENTASGDAEYETVYRARIELSPAENCTFTGLTLTGITAGGVDTAYNENGFSAGIKLTLGEGGSSAVIELVFPETAQDDPTKPQLAKPAAPTLSDMGVASWQPVANASAYTVKVYKGDTPVHTATTESTSVSVVEYIPEENPEGSYTVTVTAKGGAEYRDGPESDHSAAQNVSRRTAVQYAWWFEPSTARWVNVDGDSNYAVQLYKNGSKTGDPVTVTRQDTTDPENADQTVTTHDFSAAINEAGYGTYRFGVLTKGNGGLVLDAAEEKSSNDYAYDNPAAQKLPAPTGVALSEQGVATWTASSPETGVISYAVQLYKGGSPHGSAETVAQGSAYSKDFLSVMLTGGSGVYTVKVKAVGDGTTYNNSDEVTSGERGVSTRITVQYAWWFETTKARWVNVDGDSNYTVQLYKNGSKTGDPVTVTRQDTTDPENADQTVTTHDFTSAITQAGSGTYRFGVITKGNGGLILDAAEEKSSDDHKYVAPDPVKGVRITFTATNESGNLTVTPPTAPTVSKTGTTKTLTLTVAGDGFTAFTWVVDDVPISASGSGITLGDGGATLTINAPDSAVKLGGHSVTVYATKSGVPWSPSNPVKFTVTK